MTKERWARPILVHECGGPRPRHSIPRPQLNASVLPTLGTMTLRNALSAVAMIAIPLTTASQSVSRSVSTIAAPDTAQVRAAIAFLATGSRGATLGYHAAEAGHWNVDSIMRRMSTAGLLISDVNEADSSWRATASQLRSEIVARKGRSFEELAYLGFICEITDPSRVRLTVAKEDGRVDADVDAIHRLVFVREGTEWRLRCVKLVWWQAE